MVQLVGHKYMRLFTSQVSDFLYCMLKPSCDRCFAIIHLTDDGCWTSEILSLLFILLVLLFFVLVLPFCVFPSSLFCKSLSKSVSLTSRKSLYLILAFLILAFLTIDVLLGYIKLLQCCGERAANLHLLVLITKCGFLSIFFLMLL